MGGINYVSTVLNMRTKGMDLWKMPLTVWALFLTAVLGVLAFPVLVAGDRAVNLRPQFWYQLLSF